MKSELKFTDGRSLELGSIFCIGQNYARHAREMGSRVSEAPTVFLKPPQSYLPEGGKIWLPDFSNNIHYEVELVVVVGEECVDVSPGDALGRVAGYAVGIDVTLRDVQAAAKKEGAPWTTAKGFRTSGAISQVVPAAAVELPDDLSLELNINGMLAQSGSTCEMERGVSELISYISRVFGLRAGDVIFTGTPEGVGKIPPAAELEARLLTTRRELIVSARWLS